MVLWQQKAYGFLCIISFKNVLTRKRIKAIIKVHRAVYGGLFIGNFEIFKIFEKSA